MPPCGLGCDGDALPFVAAFPGEWLLPRARDGTCGAGLPTRGLPTRDEGGGGLPMRRGFASPDSLRKPVLLALPSMTRNVDSPLRDTARPSGAVSAAELNAIEAARRSHALSAVRSEVLTEQPLSSRVSKSRWACVNETTSGTAGAGAAAAASG